MSASFALSKRASARSIAVVGGGASGALIAAHLLKCADDDVHLTLIEPRAQVGRGLAYATENESHRLNVRASNMSAFPDDPDLLRTRALRTSRRSVRRPVERPTRMERGARFDDSDPRDRAHDGRRRHLAERGGPSRTDCRAVAARPFASGPSPGRDRANCANGTAVAGEARGVPALASREGAE